MPAQRLQILQPGCTLNTALPVMPPRPFLSHRIPHCFDLELMTSVMGKELTNGTYAHSPYRV